MRMNHHLPNYWIFQAYFNSPHYLLLMWIVSFAHSLLDRSPGNLFLIIERLIPWIQFNSFFFLLLSLLCLSLIDLNVFIYSLDKFNVVELPFLFLQVLELPKFFISLLFQLILNALSVLFEFFLWFYFFQAIFPHASFATHFKYLHLKCSSDFHFTHVLKSAQIGNWIWKDCEQDDELWSKCKLCSLRLNCKMDTFKDNIKPLSL